MITPEQLFQIIGEVTVENRILRQQISDLEEKLREKDDKKVQPEG